MLDQVWQTEPQHSKVKVMIDDAIRDKVAMHYRQGREPLLLSELGEVLRDAALWPVEGEERPLSAVVEGIRGVSLVRDPVQKAYVIVTLAEREDEAKAFVKQRAARQWLRRVARPALVAFCLDMPDGLLVYLRPTPPIQYATSPQEGFLPIEAEFRFNGVFVKDVGELEPAMQDQLALNIRAWCERHAVSPDALTRTQPARPKLAEAPATSPAIPAATSALERLMQAQAPGVAAQIILPADIALVLSRMP
jgi:hypothetical protein